MYVYAGFIENCRPGAQQCRLTENVTVYIIFKLFYLLTNFLAILLPSTLGQNEVSCRFGLYVLVHL